MTDNKVILREAGGQDLGMLLSLGQDPGIGKVTKGYRKPAFGARRRYSACFLPVPAGSLRRVIADREHPDEGLGVVMLTDMDADRKTAQIYIKLLPSARGKGYGRDAVNAMVSYAFQKLSLNRICSGILEDNTASRRLFEACGFQLEETRECRADQNGHGRKVCTYVRRNGPGQDETGSDS